MALTELDLRAMKQAGEGMRAAITDIAISRTLTGANEAVQQIKESELNDA